MNDFRLFLNFKVMKLVGGIFFFGCWMAFCNPQLQAQAYTDYAGIYNINFNNQPLTPDGGGVSFVDFNGDGLDDLTLATGLGDSLEFYQNTGTGFIKLPSLVNHTQEAKHVLWVDYDNDGDKDLYVSSNISANKLYRMDSTGLTDVSAAAGISASVTETYGVCWGDINNDGWLDFYETNQLNFSSGHNVLYLSNGNGTFTDITQSANAADSIRYAFAAAFFDYDKDGDQDLFIANDRQAPTTLLQNNGDSTFTNVSSAAGAREIMDGMSATVGDFDNNGWLDVYVTNTQNGNKLFSNNGNGTFTEVANTFGVEHFSETWSAVFFDYDLDGDMDLHVCDVIIGQSTAETFYENVDTTFIYTNQFPGDTLRNFANAIGDINNDGYVDLVSPNKFPSQLQLWQHNATGSNHYLKVQLEGVVTNRDAIGSYIEAYAGGDRYIRYTHCGEGFLGQNSQTEIIGLGNHTLVDSLVIRWLSGHVDRYDSLMVDQKYYFLEGSSLNPEIVLSGSPILCEDDTAGLTLSVSPAFDRYLWSTGDTTANIQVNQPGLYSVVVFNEFGLTDTSQVQILTDSLHLSVSSTPDTNGMGNGTATVRVSGHYPPFSFLWDDPNAQIDSVATGLAAGTYKVRVTDSLQCEDTISVVVSSYNDASLEEFGTRALVIYPQPAHAELTFRWQSADYYGEVSATIRIYDVTGALLAEHHWDLREEATIGTAVFPEGIYLVEILSGHKDLLARKPIILSHP